MHNNVLVSYVFGVVTILFIATTMVNSSVISCPPNNIQESNSNLRQLCYAIEQLLTDASSQDQYPARLVDERNTNLNSKRQDVDHVFLRFGRRFGY